MEELSNPSPDHQKPLSTQPEAQDASIMQQSTGPDVTQVVEKADVIKAQISRVIVGQSALLEQMVIALFAGGHVLIEGVPGIGKTLTAKLLAKTIAADFSRIQFTPDLMPADVVGTSVFNVKTSEFQFKPGPIFSNIILIDEVNRAPAKTQSSLFEVMEEHQVTVDGITHQMGAPFFVAATQNPVEQEGTYKLPEAQLDRFLFRILIEYPTLDEEQAILRRFKDDFSIKSKEAVSAVVTPKDIAACRTIIEQVYIRPELLDYIAKIVHQTRSDANLFLGASPRASLAILRTAKAAAALSGRGFVTPDDIAYVAYPVLNHRIILTPEREMEGFRTHDVIEGILKKIDIPR